MLLSLRAEKHGIGSITRLDTIHAKSLPCGEVALSDEDLYRELGILPEKKHSRTSLLAMKAVKEAMGSSGGCFSESIKTGFISSTTVGGMTATENFYYAFEHQPETRDWIDKLDCGDNSRDVADYFSHRGFMTTISTACSSSANAIILGANMIKAGLLERAVCGGADALSRFTINGFNSLMLLEQEHCRPFDKDRKGLNLGEGAGFVILESETLLKKTGHKALAELVGYSNVNDAFHQTASSPDGAGARTAMSNALDMAGISPSLVSYINVHGTGTPNNDESEGKAMMALFDSVPAFSSTKSYTGHTLAAAGGIEAVISVLSLQNGEIYPNLNYRNRMDAMNCDPVTRLMTQQQLEYILSNSFGFGGNNTSLLFKNV